VPEVLACIDDPPALVLEWIEPGAGGSDEALGRSLAALHGAGAAGFGAVPDNFIGPLPQRNDERPTWPRFYAECRVEPQVRTARDAGALDAEEARRFRTLCEAMEARTGPAEPPARLHGDLWSGNAVRGADGRTWLVDPAVYGGHREVDLAMMRLFGGFAPRCFDAYEEAAPLAPGWAERVALYQIYPLLVHVNLFGIGYKDQLFQVLHSVL
jgi:fructosamine-3-kinase